MAGPAAHVLRRLFASHAFRMLLAQLGPAATAKAVELARQGRWRRLAVLHADTVDGGLVSRAALDDDADHWIVWHGEQPEAAYPPYEGDLVAATQGLDPADRIAPEDLATRRAGKTVADGARDTGRRFGTGLARARRVAADGARRASEEGARRTGRSVGRHGGGGVNRERRPGAGDS